VRHRLGRNPNRRNVTADDRQWPDILYTQWAETCQALHLNSQMVGKYRLVRAPWAIPGTSRCM
jgi:hypothetical protein